ncbi:MAG: DUF5106 domain-containing protein [Candidatus Amulumruptor caecigallinarius]|nr:DUF5106 domain-containing protein [Candidatus Amulumruptor caecigallinarius]
MKLNINYIKRTVYTAALATLSATASNASEPIVIPPLFEYAEAPDTMQNLQDRSNYLVRNFWSKMDFKSKKAVDQNALNDAMTRFTAPMRYADSEVAEEAVTNLFASLKGNPVLTLQITKAAEEALYSPRATFWNDELYLRFIDNLLSNKTLKKERKLRYERHKKLIADCTPGNPLPEFKYMTANGKEETFAPSGQITVIEFGNPDCDDCRHAKLKMETNVRFDRLVTDGKIKVYFIDTNAEEGWQKALSEYPANWTSGACADADDIFDLRFTPSFYVLDRNGNLVVKNADSATAMAIAVGGAGTIGNEPQQNSN